MLSIKVIFILILVVIFFTCFNKEESFSNGVTNRPTQNFMLEKNGKKYQVVAFSQLSNDVKKELLKNNLIEMNKIFEDELNVIIQYIDMNINFRLGNDPLFAINKKDLEKLGLKEFSISFDKLINPIYNEFYINDNKKFDIKNNYLIITNNTSSNININLKNNQINNKSIELIPIKNNSYDINLLKI